MQHPTLHLPYIILQLRTDISEMSTAASNYEKK